MSAKSKQNACIALSLGLILILPVACGQHSTDAEALQAQVTRLQHQLDSAYKPGLGEFMSGIQVHHEKLWFAGKAGNWKLADFEMGEIKESIDDIRQFCADRPEVASLPMINPAIDSLNAAIKESNPARFTSSFMLLTTTCNNCHKVTKHEFNVIKVPDTPPFSNQVFAKPSEK
ncbi:hypothetical protein [Puia dinghuensis]|uniref:Cytochrome c n=1 Tax=Puia dinghuensis TaxID=1792502 RepID=A0A8J2XSW0_9BACT|nr:hypothetical protein [Puia dinghuensis]GGA98220.1 hypothetical protein GCM10011511_21930 [Puia dinghuensis]